MMESISTEIEMSIFEKELQIMSIVIPKKQTYFVMNDPFFQQYINQNKKVKPIRSYSEDLELTQIVLLQKYNQPDDLPSEFKQKIQEKGYKAIQAQIKLDYSKYNYYEALELLLPQDVIVPSGFEIVGSIAHLNLSKEQMPYKNIIGQVILDKHKSLRTVITKIDHIESVYRNYKLETIAGIPDYVTQHKEGNCKFELDLSKVYWCSKLHNERDRMFKLIQKDQVLCDMFCGIGPLSVKVAKKGVKVIANDLNPDCFYYLKRNIEINKVVKQVLPFNLDAREFVRQLIQGKVRQTPDEEPIQIPQDFLHFDHVYMNLPVDAIEFLDVFDGLFHNHEGEIWNKNNLPTIHVYGFSPKPAKQESFEFFLERINHTFVSGTISKEDIIGLELIRDISSTSRMYSISFHLPPSVAYSQSQVPSKHQANLENEQIQPEKKKFKPNSNLEENKE